MEFKKDINGLRAFAVMAVVFYHFELLGMGGGFSGVDVFFVISGFLMTGIIWSRLQKGGFSLSDFYLSRARRILPALVVMCAALLLAGYFWLTPTDYKTLGEHAAASVGFVSNFIFKGEEGYFDAPMRYKWLLHTWSLSVEWQFYMLYPLLLMAAHRFSKNLKTVVVVTLLVFFVASVIVTPIKASFSFYLLPVRIWEFMAGAFVYAFARDVLLNKRMLEAVGFVFILASCFVFGADTPWPGHAAALPVLGTVLVLLAAREDSLLTGNALSQRLGLWSYSIYLWHWPVVVALTYLELQKSAVFAIGGIVLSLVLGAASYTFVEKPFREKAVSWPRGKSITIFAGMLAAVIAFGMSVYFFKGMPARVPAHIADIDLAVERAKAGSRPCGFDRDTSTLNRCPIGHLKGDPAFVVWGDSHAINISKTVGEAVGKGGIGYFHMCPTIFGAYHRSKSARHQCAEFNDMAFADLQKFPPSVPVVVLNRYAFYLHGNNVGIKRNVGLDYEDVAPADLAKDEAGYFKKKLAESLCKIGAGGRKVYAMKPIPEIGKDVPKVVARRLMMGRDLSDLTVTVEAYQERNKHVLEALERAEKDCGVVLLDPVPALCPDGLCNPAPAGKPIYFDDNHLNGEGTGRLKTMFVQIFAQP